MLRMLAGAMLLTLLGVVVVLVAGNRRPRKPITIPTTIGNAVMSKDPSWSPDGRRIVFVRGRPDRRNAIYVMGADGGGLKRLTRTRMFYGTPTWSPDGKLVAFAASSVGPPNGFVAGTGQNLAGDTAAGRRYSEIGVIDASGRNLHWLTHLRGFSNDPSWSPNGKQMVFDHKLTAGDDEQVYVMNADGSNVHVAFTRPLHGELFALGWEPKWSPNGGQIAFTAVDDSSLSSFEIYVMNADGSVAHRLAQNAACCPAWSPDGRTIVFVGSGGNPGRIYLINSDGSNQRSLTARSANDTFSPAWSPDGKRIAFVSSPNFGLSGDQIDVMNANGSDVHALTH
jgi:Tol biopolymer transport system component